MNLKNIGMLFIMASLPSHAAANSHETARKWIALGTVAHQCGRLSQYQVSISNEDIGVTASRESGLNRTQIINILNNASQKRKIASKVSTLKSNISNGNTSCANVILAFSSSLM
jgi:hypothetical protein